MSWFGNSVQQARQALFIIDLLSRPESRHERLFDAIGVRIDIVKRTCL